MIKLNIGDVLVLSQDNYWNPKSKSTEVTVKSIHRQYIEVASTSGYISAIDKIALYRGYIKLKENKNELV